jgi:signal transduction histidine kinase
MLPTRQFDVDTTKRALDSIARNAQSLAGVIEDVLDMSDIITGRLSLQVVTVDLVEVIKRAVEFIQVAAVAKNLTIQTQFDPATMTVMGDEARLQQCIWNLLSNAVKFTPDGGQIDVQLDYLDNQAQIQVKDTGRGIQPDFLPYVFDRFRQEDGSLTRYHGGLGIGLAIVRYLIELHGGTVEVHSPGLNQGTNFIIRLPLSHHAASATPPIEEP